MADYIYLLENRLSAAQKSALIAVRDVVRAKGMTLFLVGGAVRDLTSGSPVRDLDVSVQGNALKLKKDLELGGGTIVGTQDSAQALYLRFPGGVRLEVSSTMSATYPKPGKPVLKPGTILEDLRRRDFTANAMALSLNDGSYGLLMDPLNGVADIENRELRLVSNYGFIEEPVRMIRAARFAARLGWSLEEKTQGRYDTGKEEGYISTLSEFHRGYETEEIVHEEDPLRVMRRLESEGWMGLLAPTWGSAKANVAELEKVRESQTQLQMQGVHPDPATVNFPLLVAKMSPKDIAALKKSFPRPGFVDEIEALEGEAKEFAAQLGGKGAATPSAAYRLLATARPEAVLYVAYTTKSAALQAKFKSFFAEWPQVRQRIPYALMQEMRITPELAGYQELVEKLFFELMDGNLSTPEEMKAFLEPYSPPAPPPPVHLRRARASKKDAKGKGRAKKAAVAADDLDDDDDDEPEDAPTGSDEDEEEPEDFGNPAELAGGDADVESDSESDADEDEEDEDEPPPPPVKAPKAPASKAPAAKTAPAAVLVKTPAKTVAVEAPKAVVKSPVVAKVAPASKSPAKKVVVAPAKTAKKIVVGKSTGKTAVVAKAKAPVKVATKAPVKAAAVKAVPAKGKTSAKPVPAKKVVVQAAAKKAAPAKVAAKKPVKVAAKKRH